jgi:hypothetical protein
MSGLVVSRISVVASATAAVPGISSPAMTSDMTTMLPARRRAAPPSSGH